MWTIICDILVTCLKVFAGAWIVSVILLGILCAFIRIRDMVAETIEEEEQI